MKRLALNIDALAEKDGHYSKLASEMASVRLAAALEIHTICREFVASVNRLLQRTEISLDPLEFSAEIFHEDTLNLIQISVRGRILQIAFNVTPELISTEDFRVPYTIEGTVRAFNQELLEKEIIEEQLIFYTVEKERKMWRFFDPRTYKSGTFEKEYLVSVMEQLI